MAECACRVRRKSPPTKGVAWFDDLEFTRCPLHENAEKLLLLLESPLINGSEIDVAEWFERREIAIKAIREAE